MKPYIVRVVKDKPEDFITDDYGFCKVLSIIAESEKDAVERALKLLKLDHPEEYEVIVV